MKTNDIKKGARILLRNGWYGTMADNMRGNTRVVDVEGHFRETGSVYSHDIRAVEILIPGPTPENGQSKVWVFVEHTSGQVKLREQLEAMGM